MISSGLKSKNWSVRYPKEEQKGTRTAWDILLVGEHQQEGVLHFPIVDDLVQLRAGLLQSRGIAGIHHEDQALGAGVVVSPEGPNLVLAADVPHVELDILIGDALDVEADSRDSGDVLVAEFQFVENC